MHDGIQFHPITEPLSQDNEEDVHDDYDDYDGGYNYNGGNVVGGDGGSIQRYIDRDREDNDGDSNDDREEDEEELSFGFQSNIYNNILSLGSFLIILYVL